MQCKNIKNIPRVEQLRQLWSQNFPICREINFHWPRVIQCNRIKNIPRVDCNIMHGERGTIIIDDDLTKRPSASYNQGQLRFRLMTLFSLQVCILCVIARQRFLSRPGRNWQVLSFLETSWFSFFLFFHALAKGRIEIRTVLREYQASRCVPRLPDRIKTLLSLAIQKTEDRAENWKNANSDQSSAVSELIESSWF